MLQLLSVAEVKRICTSIKGFQLDSSVQVALKIFKTKGRMRKSAHGF